MPYINEFEKYRYQYRKVILKNIDIDVDKGVLQDIDIDKAILKNIDIAINIDHEIL